MWPPAAVAWWWPGPTRSPDVAGELPGGFAVKLDGVKLLVDADGDGVEASFSSRFWIALSHDESYLYVSDMMNHKIRMVDLTTKRVLTFVGSGSPGYTEVAFTLASDNIAAAQHYFPPAGVAASDGHPK